MKTFRSSIAVLSSTTTARVAVQMILLIAWIALQREPVRAQEIQLETQQLVFAQLAIGGGWESELTLVAQGADTSSGRIEFLNQIGGGMIVSVDGGPEVTGINYSLPSRSSRTFRLTSNAPTSAGWILVTSQAGNNNHGSINGMLTYRYRDAGIVVSQVGILPSQAVTHAHLPYDETNYNLTAMAIVTFNRMDLEIERYEEDGDLGDRRVVNFGPSTQQALYVHELFPGAMNTRGFLLLKSNAPFNMTALNVNNDKWSGLASLPGVFERELTLSIAGLSSYRVRLIRNGNFLYGTAEMANRPGVYRSISGSIAKTGQRSILQLNLHSFLDATGEGLNITMIAPVSDLKLLSVTGRAVAIKEDGSVFGSGSFSLSTSSGAQF